MKLTRYHLPTVVKHVLAPKNDFGISKITWQIYKSGEVISDQFNHLILIQNLENSEKNRRKQEVLENTFFDDFPH